MQPKPRMLYILTLREKYRADLTLPTDRIYSLFRLTGLPKPGQIIDVPAQFATELPTHYDIVQALAIPLPSAPVQLLPERDDITM